MAHNPLSSLMSALLLYAAINPAVLAQPAPLPEDLLLDDDLLDAIEQDVLAALPANNHARLSHSRDNAGNTQLHADAQIAILSDTLLDIGAGRSNIDDDVSPYTTRSLRLGIGSSAYDGFNWYASYSDWGKSDAIETRDGLIELSYRQQHWWASVQYQQGDVTLYIAPQFSSRRSSLNSGRDAIGARIGYRTGDARWWLSWLKRRYDRDISRINSSALLQEILQTVALDQAYALTRNEYAAGYQWYWQQTDVQIELDRTISAVDNTGSDFISVTVNHYFDTTLSVSAGLSTAPGNSLTTFTIGIGYSW